MTTTAMQHCEFSHTPVDGRHLTGDATLRSHCPGCGRQYVPAYRIGSGGDSWALREHTPLYPDWPTHSPGDYGGPF